MNVHRSILAVITLSQIIFCAYGYWTNNGFGYNQPFDMQSGFYNFPSFPDPMPQSYHYQQMNGNQLVNQPPQKCNCIKLKFCYPVMEMAKNMYTGFINDYINSQLQVIACNYIDGEMAVCCPNQNEHSAPVTNNKHGGFMSRNHGSPNGNQQHSSQGNPWAWNTEDANTSEEKPKQPPPQYPPNQYVSYPIQGFFPYPQNPFLKNINKGPFLTNHEDPLTMKNCPPEIPMVAAQNFTIAKEIIETSTPVLRLATTAAPTPSIADSLIRVPTEIQDKMSMINSETCGRSVGSRIIGGSDAGVGRFSWMSRLAYRNKTSDKITYRCAGSVISDRYVITAGHCVSNLVESLELVMIRLGDVDEEQENECDEDGFCLQEEDYEIEKTTVHPNYNNPRYAHDIALIRLKQSTASSRSIGPICMPFGQYQDIGSMASTGSNGIIAGWGARSQETESQSTMLQWIRLPFIETPQCAEFYANYTANYRTRIRISNSQLCIQGRENGDACAGDSGGPLMNEAELNDDKFILLGLVSFGPRMCGLSNFPGVYTRVSSYMEWILKNMEP